MGGYSWYLNGWDAADYRNWVTDKSVPPPYPPGWPLYRPGPEDDVFFNGYVSNAPCDMTNAVMEDTYKSMHLANLYAGVVTTPTIGLGDLELRSGTINPYSPWIGDIEVTGAFTWTGGTLNGTAYHHYLELVGAEATVTPPTAGLVTGSTLAFGADGSGPDGGSKGAFNPGTVNFNNGADVIVTDLCLVQINPAALAVVFQNNQPAEVSQDIVEGGRLTVVSGPGTFNSSGRAVKVAGGTYKVEAPATANITGRVDGGRPAGRWR